MISKAQDKLYWREWSQAAKQLRAYGFEREEIEEKRRELTSEATDGRTDSHKEMRRVGEFTEWLKLAAAIHSPDDLDKQLELLKQPAKVHAFIVAQIEALRLPDAYLETICRDVHGTADWRELPDDDLRKFRMTAKRCASSFSKT